MTQDDHGKPARHRQDRSLSCLRCNLAMRFVGTGRFHEGHRWGVLGDLGELFVEKVELDIYACPRCGAVEFFIDGHGEHLRPPEIPPGD